ncbi:hypothetical protein SDC9_177452 [bioreactor metagenome]|uniref:Uncharacterized protein n=1 Tax=bioreactor metagenome TaxID=1076179 RepID=A0A645GTA2_9ZZZZ
MREGQPPAEVPEILPIFLNDGGVGVVAVQSHDERSFGSGLYRRLHEEQFWPGPGLGISHQFHIARHQRLKAWTALQRAQIFIVAQAVFTVKEAFVQRG